MWLSTVQAIASSASLNDNSFAQVQIPHLKIQKNSVTPSQDIVDKIAKKINDQLGWYGELDRETGISAAQMSKIAVDGLKNGTYDAVIMGESHGNPIEQSAAHLILGSILSSGVHVGAFMAEATTVQNGAPISLLSTEQFTKAKVPTALFDNQFNPEADIERGLKMAGSRIFITYTGSSHTSIAMRNYSQESLKESDLGWNKIYPGRPTVEQSILKHHKLPIIIAMREESSVLDWIEYSAIAQTSKNTTLAAFKENLAALKIAWDQSVSQFAPRTTIGFIPSPEQSNLYLGITPTDRRPLEIEALIKAANTPELSQWLGNKKILSAESNLVSNCSPKSSFCCQAAQIYIYSGKNERLPACVSDLKKPCFKYEHNGFNGQYGDIFARTICAENLP